MKQRYHRARFRIDGREVGAFVQIAPITCQREIGGIVATAVLAGDDVFDVKRGKRDGRLGKTTVFTPLPRSAADQFTRGGIHHRSA